MSYDQGCYKLAIQFLGDHCDPIPLTKASELAQVIQDAIEMYLEYDLPKEGK